MKFAKWKGDEYRINNELMAKPGDLLEVHAKSNEDNEYILKGPHSESFFWAYGTCLKFYEEV